MAGIKKSIRPINKAKNHFVNWLKKNKAEDVDIYDPLKEDDDRAWEYYIHISAFVGDDLYDCCFSRFQGKDRIEYSDPSVRYNNIGIEEFIDIIV